MNADCPPVPGSEWDHTRTFDPMDELEKLSASFSELAILTGMRKGDLAEEHQCPKLLGYLSSRLQEVFEALGYYKLVRHTQQPVDGE